MTGYEAEIPYGESVKLYLLGTLSLFCVFWAVGNLVIFWVFLALFGFLNWVFVVVFQQEIGQFSWVFWLVRDFCSILGFLVTFWSF